MSPFSSVVSHCNIFSSLILFTGCLPLSVSCANMYQFCLLCQKSQFFISLKFCEIFFCFNFAYSLIFIVYLLILDLVRFVAFLGHGDALLGLFAALSNSLGKNFLSAWCLLHPQSFTCCAVILICFQIFLNLLWFLLLFSVHSEAYYSVFMCIHIFRVS